MGRHRMHIATPDEDEPSEGTRSLPLRGISERRRRNVLGAAAGVVSVLALGGVVTLARSFAPAEAHGCAPACATERPAGHGVAEPRQYATRSTSRSAQATPGRTAREAGRTLEPAVVRGKKRVAPSPTPTPSLPIELPRPPWRDHGPGRHGHWPW